MRKLLVICTLLLTMVGAMKAQDVQYLTQDEFRKIICDYKKVEAWEYKGNVPCVIDCYASWCGPCKRLAPILEEVAAEYKGKVRFYKMDMDQEKEVARALGIASYPTVLLISKNKKQEPTVAVGLRPKEFWIEAIDEVLLGKKPAK